MRLLPNITGTVGHWPFQGSLADTSGNGNNMAVANSGSGGVIAYATMDTCLQGFQFDNGTNHSGLTALIAPVASVLQITGNITIQYDFIARRTFSQTIFAMLNPTASSVLYDSFTGADTNLNWYDNQGPREFSPAVSWTPYAVAQTPVAWAYVRDMTAGFVYLYANGVLLSSLPVTSFSAAGTEQLALGGFAANGFGTLLSGVMADLRIVNYARTPTQIAADATISLTPYTGPLNIAIDNPPIGTISPTAALVFESSSGCTTITSFTGFVTNSYGTTVQVYNNGFISPFTGTITPIAGGQQVSLSNPYGWPVGSLTLTTYATDTTPTTISASRTWTVVGSGGGGGGGPIPTPSYVNGGDNTILYKFTDGGKPIVD